MHPVSLRFDLKIFMVHKYNEICLDQTQRYDNVSMNSEACLVHRVFYPKLCILFPSIYLASLFLDPTRFFLQLVLGIFCSDSSNLMRKYFPLNALLWRDLILSPSYKARNKCHQNFLIRIYECDECQRYLRSFSIQEHYHYIFIPMDYLLNK